LAREEVKEKKRKKRRKKIREGINKREKDEKFNPKIFRRKIL